LRTSFVGVAVVGATMLTSIGYGRPIDPSEVAVALASVRDIASVVLSADGKKVAFLVRQADPASNRYHQEWMAVSVSGTDRPQPIADGGEASPSVAPNGSMVGELGAPSAEWSPDGKWLAFARDDNGSTQLWKAPAAGGVVEQLSHGNADVEEIHWAPDSSRIYFTTGRDRNAANEADRIDGLDGLLVDEPMPALDSPTRTRWPKCEKQPPSVMEVAADRMCTPVLRAYDLDRRAERLATQGESAVPFASRQLVGSQTALSPNGRRRAIFENPDPQKFPGLVPPTRLTIEEMATGHKTTCAAPACTSFDPSRQIWWSDDGEKVFLLTREGPTIVGPVQSLYEWTPATNKLRRILSSEEWRIRDCSKARDTLVCIRNGWTKPDHLVAVDLSRGTVRTLADPNSDLTDLPRPKVETVYYDDGMGVDTYGHLVFPTNYVRGKRYPLVVVQYRSSGFLKGGIGDEQPIPAYAQAGMFVLSTNLPEDDTLGAHMTDAQAFSAAFWDDTFVRRRGLRAIERAIEILDRRGLIDPARMGITGLSTGATITEQALIHSNRFAAASAAYANTSPLNYYSFPSSGARKVLFGGQHPFFGKGLEMWRENSSGLVAVNPDGRKVPHVPYLLQVADREYYDSLQNYVDLRDAGAPVELYVFPNEYHVKWQPAHKLAVYRRNLDWFRFWLQDYEAEFPSLQPQYARWRELRRRQSALIAASAPHARGLPAQSCPLSCSSRLHLLRSWSLRQTRRGSLSLNAQLQLLNQVSDLIAGMIREYRQADNAVLVGADILRMIYEYISLEELCLACSVSFK
jgi:dipeptidyl aminopeptidase/acylaminoacyl peptidase